MNGSYFVDTNIAIAFMGGSAAVASKFAQANRILVCVSVLGELWYGAERSQQQAANRSRIATFEQSVDIVDIDSKISQAYGRIKNALRAIGRPIPNNDLWIAAAAVQRGLPLVTRDQHFNHVAGLVCDVW
jgi:tRNA(fMet)-specific endonuclease VapC